MPSWLRCGRGPVTGTDVGQQKGWRAPPCVWSFLPFLRMFTPAGLCDAYVCACVCPNRLTCLPPGPADPDPGAVDQLEGDPGGWDAAFRCAVILDPLEQPVG